MTTTVNSIRAALALGQSIWYDNIQRAMLARGELARLINDDGLRGLTSNPTIFEKAITGSSDYDQALQDAVRLQSGLDREALFYALAIDDITAAADLLRPVYDASGAKDGMVSIEVSPDLAHDTAGTVAQALRLHELIARTQSDDQSPGDASRPARHRTTDRRRHQRQCDAAVFGATLPGSD